MAALRQTVMVGEERPQERQKEEVRKPLGTGISLRCRHFWSEEEEENNNFLLTLLPTLNN